MTKYLAFFTLFFYCLPAGAQTALETLRGAAPAAEVNSPEPPRFGGGAGKPVDVSGPDGFPAQAAAAYRSLPNYITLHTIPSPAPMDWTSVGSLALAFARNEIAVELLGQTHSIGHVAFEIGCTLPDGSRTFLMTGQSPVSMKGFSEQVKQGSGFGAFFGYVEGRLQTEDELNQSLTRLSKKNKEAAFLTMQISRESCLEASRYMAAYRSEGVYTRYGLGVRPLYAEGGGCANVGASVLEVAAATLRCLRRTVRPSRCSQSSGAAPSTCLKKLWASPATRLARETSPPSCLPTGPGSRPIPASCSSSTTPIWSTTGSCAPTPRAAPRAAR